MFRNTEYRSRLLGGSLCGISQCSSGSSIGFCAFTGPTLGQNSLNALYFSRRDSKGMRGLLKTWKGYFDCDLAAHLVLTLDGLNWNCNRGMIPSHCLDARFNQGFLR